MSGVFSSSVLSVLEKANISNRIHSIYATSTWACTAARFLAEESNLGGKTFYQNFNNTKFMKLNFVRYFFEVLRKNTHFQVKINDIVDFDYFRKIVLESDVKIDIEKVKNSEIPLYVKVFNCDRNKHEWLKTVGNNAFEKILASASMAPITQKPIKIDGQKYFDGDSISSNIEYSIVKKHKDKKIIRIVNKKESLLWYFNVFALLIPYILFKKLYNFNIANKYGKGFFKHYFWENSIQKCDNVISIINDKNISPFCINTKKLKNVFNHGITKGEILVNKIAK